MASLLAVLAVLATVVSGVPSPQSLMSDLTILVSNDLQGPSSPVADSGVILLSENQSAQEAADACTALGENLWSPELNTSSIQPNLDYLVYQKKVNADNAFWIGGGRVISASGNITDEKGEVPLPVLCTHTAPFSNNSVLDTSSQWQVTVNANNETLVGFRDRMSFRFQGIRYAPQPERFTYSTAYIGSGGNVSALDYGSQCIQPTGSEDCLFLNIWTPFLPQNTSQTANLKPVMFWIHGGAFTGGTGSDPTFDGGNLASRGDVVMVAINYRLTTLGYLALKDGVTNGNFGFGDQIVALDWVRDNIANFGGDPDRITVFGQSAGAGSVRAMMASPKAVGKFAAALPMSNLGGLAYGTTYSEYYTIDQEVDVAASAILNATNCTSAASQVDCLRAVNASTLANLATVARYIVVDGTYITSPHLQLNNGSRLPLNLMMGTMAEDGAPFISYTYNVTADNTDWLTSQALPYPSRDVYPLQNITNITLAVDRMAGRVATDGIFRCVDQATVYAGLQSGILGDQIYYYEFDRSYQTQGWPDLNLCEPPPTAANPNGDPESPIGYEKCHSGDLLYVFGNLNRMGLPWRDDKDLPFSQYILDQFTSFARTYDPNPDPAYLTARGYNTSLGLITQAGKWSPSVNNTLVTRVLDWPGANTEVDFPAPDENMMSGFRDLDQCIYLGLPITYYL